MSNNAKRMAEELPMVLFRAEAAIVMFVKAKSFLMYMLKQVNILVKYSKLGPEFGLGPGLIWPSCGRLIIFGRKTAGAAREIRRAYVDTTSWCIAHFTLRKMS